MKLAARIFLFALGIVAVMFIAAPYVFSWLVSNSQEKSWVAMSQDQLVCPENTEITTRGWSEAGYSRYCEPNMSGPWEAWADGHLRVQGNYLNGEQTGTWRWFNEDGDVTKIVEYRNGEAVPNGNAE